MEKPIGTFRIGSRGPCPEDAESRQIDRLPDGKGDEIDLVAPLARSLQDVPQGDGSSTVLVERLRRHDENPV